LPHDASWPHGFGPGNIKALGWGTRAGGRPADATALAGAITPAKPVDKENTVSDEVTGNQAAKDGLENAVGHAKEFAGEAAGNVKEFAGQATENVKEFLSGDVADNAKELASDVAGNAKGIAGGVTENVKGFGARIAGLFKGGN
jgi:uncharacterized protein YjbJ (UPF0337 family)